MAAGTFRLAKRKPTRLKPFKPKKTPTFDLPGGIGSLFTGTGDIPAPFPPFAEIEAGFRKTDPIQDLLNQLGLDRTRGVASAGEDVSSAFGGFGTFGPIFEALSRRGNPAEGGGLDLNEIFANLDDTTIDPSTGEPIKGDIGELLLAQLTGEDFDPDDKFADIREDQLARDEAGTSTTALLADQFQRGVDQSRARPTGRIGSSGRLNREQQELEQGLLRAVSEGGDALRDFLRGTQEGLAEAESQFNRDITTEEQAFQDRFVESGEAEGTKNPPGQPSFIGQDIDPKTGDPRIGVKWGGKGNQTRIWTNAGSFHAWLRSHGSSFSKWARNPANAQRVQWFRQQNPKQVARLLQGQPNTVVDIPNLIS